jgi:hypothetical protein
MKAQPGVEAVAIQRILRQGDANQMSNCRESAGLNFRLVMTISVA